jgi:hypothetical protein
MYHELRKRGTSRTDHITIERRRCRPSGPDGLRLHPIRRRLVRLCTDPEIRGPTRPVERFRADGDRPHLTLSVDMRVAVMRWLAG